MRFFVFAVCVTVAAAQYEGHQLLQLLPQTEVQSRFLRELMIQDVDLDFWTEPSRVNSPVDILVPPHKMEFLRSQTRAMSIPYTVLENNIQESVNREKELLAKKTKNFNLNDWNDYDEINDWVNDLQCPSGVTCSTRSIGTTYQGRDMTVFSMSTGGQRKAMWLDSAIHAREWLAPATLINIMDRMVTGYGSDSEVTALLNEFDFYFLPVMNPDGYQYTFTNARLHRKNLAPNPGSTCLGTDLNRNYNYRWSTEGVSTNPCSDLFCGSSGGSELETQAVQNEGARLRSIYGESFNSWITFHSYGYMWMHPWGNTVNGNGFVCERAEDHDEMFAIADATADAIESVYNTRWARGTSCEVIYETTGATDDYMKGVNDIKYTICPELRGNGFIVDTSQIALSFNEIWAGLVKMADLV